MIFSVFVFVFIFPQLTLPSPKIVDNDDDHKPIWMIIIYSYCNINLSIKICFFVPIFFLSMGNWRLANTHTRKTNETLLSCQTLLFRQNVWFWKFFFFLAEKQTKISSFLYLGLPLSLSNYQTIFLNVKSVCIEFSLQ